jgi:hypothetical protein
MAELAASNPAKKILNAPAILGGNSPRDRGHERRGTLGDHSIGSNLGQFPEGLIEISPLSTVLDLVLLSSDSYPPDEE